MEPEPTLIAVQKKDNWWI